MKRETTIGELIELSDANNGAMIQLVDRRSNVAERAVIVVQGIPETDEILSACEAVEKKWRKDETK